MIDTAREFLPAHTGWAESHDREAAVGCCSGSGLVHGPILMAQCGSGPGRDAANQRLGEFSRGGNPAAFTFPIVSQSSVACSDCSHGNSQVWHS